MANFDNSAAKLQSIRDAANLLQLFRALYSQAKLIQTALTLYQANTDPVFNAAVNALFSTSERSELNTMAQQINTLVTDWETNHIGALNS